MKDFKLIKKAYGISEYLLTTNGLRILIKKDSTYPVAGIMMTYLIGSRHEGLGETGSAHLLEHMMFKGTKNFNKAKGTDMSHLFDRWGAYYNATTWADRTNYYEVSDIKNLETMLNIKAEQMTSANITNNDLSTEMPAVMSEFAIGENDPSHAIDTYIWNSAFGAHGYGHATIGWESDIKNTSAKKLKAFYKKYYRPDNATLTIVGDIDEKGILVLIRKNFADIKNPVEKLLPLYTEEPAQEGTRRIEIIRNTPENIVTVAHKSPKALHADTPALILLSHILNGSKISRLEKALVDSGLAIATYSMYYPFYDPGLFTQEVILTKKGTHRKIEKVILDEYKILQNTLIAKKELRAAQAHIKSEFSKMSDGPYNVLSTINESIAVGDWKFYFDTLQAIEKITPADIQKVAQKYLQDKTATIGYFIEKS